MGLFERHKYEVVGSSNRSILYLGTSELKVISMIYAPPYLLRRRFRRYSRSQDRNVSEGIRESTQEVNTGKAINGDASINTKQTQQRNNKKETRDNALRYRIYRRERLLTGHTTILHVYDGSSFLGTQHEQRLLTWHLTQAWHITQSLQEVKHKVNYLC